MKTIFARVTRRGALLIIALLGLLVGAPSSLLTPLQAHASCYYTNYEDYRTWSGFSGHTFFSDDVYYRIYYSCSGYPESVTITGIYESYWSDRNPFGTTYTHYWNPTSLYSPSQATFWDDHTYKQCDNSCSLNKQYPLNVGATYDYNVRVHTSIGHCGPSPGPYYGCAFDHYFLQGTMSEWDY